MLCYPGAPPFIALKFYNVRGKPHPKYKANSESHCGLTGNELHDGAGAERGPVDRDGAKSKHSTSSIRGLRVSPGRFVGL